MPAAADKCLHAVGARAASAALRASRRRATPAPSSTWTTSSLNRFGPAACVATNDDALRRARPRSRRATRARPGSRVERRAAIHSCGPGHLGSPQPGRAEGERRVEATLEFDLVIGVEQCLQRGAVFVVGIEGDPRRRPGRATRTSHDRQDRRQQRPSDAAACWPDSSTSRWLERRAADAGRVVRDQAQPEHLGARGDAPRSPPARLTCPRGSRRWSAPSGSRRASRSAVRESPGRRPR